MIRITNTLDEEMTANSGHVVPALGELSVSEKTFERICEDRKISMRLARGHLVAMSEEDPAPDLSTREGIASADRPQLLELLEAHGLDPEEIDGTYSDDADGLDLIRELAARTVFVGL